MDYSSAKQIAINQHRSLYPEMLQLLKTQVSTMAKKDDIGEEDIEFWLVRVLPLMFDENATIQNKAIEAIEAFVQTIENIKYYEHSYWPGVRENILKIYIQALQTNIEKSVKIEQIWFLLIKICQNDVLKTAKVFNVFLKVPDTAFRNANQSVRVLAFKLWQVCIDIFVQNRDLNQKRFNLLRTPLTAVQCKSPEASLQKVKCWWHFLCQLRETNDDESCKLYKDFLVYCFGINDDNGHPFSVNVFPEINEYALVLLILSMGMPNKEVEALQEKLGIEMMTVPIVKAASFKRFQSFIIRSALKATHTVSLLSSGNTAIFQCLWNNLLTFVDYDDTECMTFLCNQLGTHLNTENSTLHEYYINVLEIITASSRSPFNRNLVGQNVGKAVPNIDIFLRFLLDFVHVDEQMKRFVEKALTYNPHRLKDLTAYCGLLNIFVQYLNKPHSSLKTPFDCWFSVAAAVHLCLQKRPEEWKIVQESSTLLIEILTWPLKNLKHFKSPQRALQLLSDILSTVEPLGILEYEAFIKDLQKVFTKDPCNANFLEIVAALLEGINCINDDKLRNFSFVCGCLEDLRRQNPTLITKSATIISSLEKLIKRHSADVLFCVYERLTNLLAQYCPNEKRLQQVNNDLKEKLKNHLPVEVEKFSEPNNFTNFIKKSASNGQTKDDEFVTVPVVWKFDPSKLTEHQKEKLKQRRSDIPALYNDASQSQDSHSIKPWSPRSVTQWNNKENNSKSTETNTPTPTINEATNGNETGVGETQDLVNANKLVATVVTNDKETFKEKTKKRNNEIKRLNIDMVESGTVVLRNSPKIRVLTRRQSMYVETPKDSEINLENTENTKKIMNKEQANTSVIRKALRNSAAMEATNKNNKMVKEKKPVKLRSTRNSLKRSEPQPGSSASDSEEVDDTKKDSEENVSLASFVSNGGNKEMDDESRDITQNEKEVGVKTSSIETPAHQNEELEVNKESSSNNIMEVDEIESGVIISSEDEASEVHKSIPPKKPPTTSPPSQKNKTDGIEESPVISPIREIKETESINKTPTPVIDSKPSSSSSPPENNTDGIEKSPVISPIREIKETESINKSPMKVNDSIVVDPKSPKPYSSYRASLTNKSLNTSIISCYDLDDIEDVNKGELLDATADISPIALSKENRSGVLLDDNSLATPLGIVKDNLIPDDDAPMLPTSSLTTPQLPIRLTSTPQQIGALPSKNPLIRFGGRSARFLQLAAETTMDDIPVTPPSSKVEAVKPPTSANRSVTGSPSLSILKRRVPDDTVDEFESPASKRKRVSFHDPPVSRTREFIPPPRHHHSAKRLDSSNSLFGNLEEMNGISILDTSISEEQQTDEVLTFSNEEAVLQHVMKKYSAEKLLDAKLEHIKNEYQSSEELIGAVLNKITANVAQNNEYKDLVFGNLALRHPKDFLKYAIKENIATEVFDSFSSNLLLDYHVSQSENNTDVKQNLLERVCSVLLKPTEDGKMTNETHALIFNLMQVQKIDEHQLCKLMEAAFRSKLPN